MRRRRTLRSALTTALLAGTLAGGLTQVSAADAPGDTAEKAASPGLVAALQRDLGLSEKEALARLEAEAKARTVESAARRAAGAAYGGSWFDAGHGRLTVALTGARTDQDRRRAVEATGARVVPAAHTLRRLETTMRSVDTLDAPAGVASWHVDPRAGAVVVRVVEGHRHDDAVRAFVADAREAGPVAVRETPQAPRTFAAGTVGGDPYYTGNVRCSIGFSVHGGFVTAGHCGGTGSAVRGWDGSHIGTFQGSSFPGDDYAWVNVGSGWWTVPVVLGWGTVPDRLVRGSAEAPVGASVCRSGSTTHWHCGTVLAKNETVNYSQGAVHQMTKTSVCAEPGDSGGSFISGDQAQGVTSGGWGNCSGGGETWHQPINEILQRYGLTLHTA
ncbi:S1 family peptidase [Streptomyces sp. RKND-216]|uniref:S1 family peptidase n=1 Tax=Streptomyces sp. RKND-216 TaxID=2562581 RepID=UPI00109E0E26|nr:S1 family peptidase [Streptomyces sp. RKND-216]THA24473.1 S1 family peptidase [Streptomyces sp. RKND-216]